MDEKQTMLDALVATIEKDYRDSISLAVVYGSYVTGLTSPKSDVDVVFVGKDERAFKAQRTFIFKGVGYDFFCMPADLVRRIVDESQPLVSIFAEGWLIYADSPERKTCFAELQHRLRTADQNTRPTRYAKVIEQLLKEMKALAFDHRRATTAEQRHIQGKVVMLSGDMLARVNRTYFRFGTKRFLDEISGFELKPDSVSSHLQPMMRDAVTTEDLTGFVLAMQEFWTGVKLTHGEPLKSDDLRGFYEEAVSTWNKIDAAAKSGDVPLTFLAAANLENELAWLRSKGISLTSMFEGSPTKPADIALNAATNQRELIQALRQRAVPMAVFDDIADVIRYIQGEEQK